MPSLSAPAAAVTPAARAWVTPVTVGATALAGCVAVGMSEDGASYLPGCPFRAATGLDCPGCGMTRATRQLVRLHPGAAADFNVLLVASLPVVAYLYLSWLVRSSTGRALPLPRVGARGGAVLVGLVVVFSVVRNLPVGPGRWLNSVR
jgi:hypothetical protein